MKDNKYLAEFGKPFPITDVSWKLQHTVKDKMRGLAVPYLDARAVSDRLDEVVGQNNWKDEYSPWHRYTDKVKQQGKETEKLVNSQLCTIYIFDEDKKEWIGKTDGAENTDFEAVKGGLSDSFKRAAVKWNIGRYMYSFDGVWVDIEDMYGKLVIADHEQQKLQDIYYKTVVKLFGKDAIEAPVNNGQKKNTDTPKQQQQNQQEKPKQKNGNIPVYEIQHIDVQNGQQGSVSSFILACGRNRYRAVMKGCDQRLRKGSKITNVEVQQCQNAGKSYNMINSYDIAA